MSIRLHRFDFGSLRDFRGPMTVEVIADETTELPPPPPPPPTFSETDLEAARFAAQKLGYAEGFEAGLARAAEQADVKRQAVDGTVMKLGTMLSTLHGGYQKLLVTEAEALSQLLLMIARKVAGEALEANGHKTIATLVKQCLPVVLSKPRLIIELNPNAFESTIDYIESQLHVSGYEGEVQFRSNSAIDVNDVILDWGTGQATRSVAALWQEIETLMKGMPVTITPPDVEHPATAEPQFIAEAQNDSAATEETPPTV